jgi:hypothetical protein
VHQLPRILEGQFPGVESGEAVELLAFFEDVLCELIDLAFGDAELFQIGRRARK